MDAIGDFTVQQTPSAEFGVKGGAAINVVMKSGTNTLHGTGYYFRHDDWTDSPNYFVKRARGGRQVADPTPTKNQQYGGTFGGPIQQGQDVLLRLLRGPAPGRHLAVRRARADARRRSPRRAARIAAAGLQTNPIGENLLKYYPTDPTGNINVNAPNVVEHEHVLGEDRPQPERQQPDQRPRVLRQELPVGAGRQQRRNRPAQRSDRHVQLGDRSDHRRRWSAWSGTRRCPTRRCSKRASAATCSRRRSSRTTRSIRRALGINTGPLDPADLGVPGVTTPFGHIGGVGGYPITTKPTTTTQMSIGADADARISTRSRSAAAGTTPTTAASGTRRARR